MATTIIRLGYGIWVEDPTWMCTIRGRDVKLAVFFYIENYGDSLRDIWTVSANIYPQIEELNDSCRKALEGVDEVVVSQMGIAGYSNKEKIIAILTDPDAGLKGVHFPVEYIEGILEAFAILRDLLDHSKRSFTYSIGHEKDDSRGWHFSDPRFKTPEEALEFVRSNALRISDSVLSAKGRDLVLDFKVDRELTGRDFIELLAFEKPEVQIESEEPKEGENQMGESKALA